MSAPLPRAALDKRPLCVTQDSAALLAVVSQRSRYAGEVSIELLIDFWVIFGEVKLNCIRF